MSLDVYRYERNIDAAADFDVIHAETNQLQKMSLSDPPQEQNKKRNLVGSGPNQFQTSSPGATACVDDEEAKESMKRQREWHALNTYTSCGFFDHNCRCKVRAPRSGRAPTSGQAPRWGHLNGLYELKKNITGKDGLYEDDNTLPPWLAKRRQKVLDEMKDSEFSLLVLCQIK